MTLVRWIVIPTVASSILFVALVLICRQISRLSPRIGLIVGFGLATRLIVALGLFWVSYLHLPFARSLQLGGGFWSMALDGYTYHLTAAYGAEHGVSTVPMTIGSPGYVRALALWMTVFGISPISAVLLNLTLYVGTSAVLVKALRRLPAPTFETIGTITVLSIVLSPMLLFASAQPLKDPFFLFFAVLLSVGSWLMSTALRTAGPSAWRLLRTAGPAIAVGVFLTAGVRTYYPIIAGSCLMLMLAVEVLYRRAPWRMLIAAMGIVVVSLGVGLGLGSPDGLAYIRLLSGPEAPVSAIETSRRNFIAAGGATNIARPAPTPSLEAVGAAEPEQSLRPQTGSRLVALVIGLATVFVPTSVLNALSIVHVSGNAAMLLLGDIDTLFFDAVLIALCVFSVRAFRTARLNVPYLVFTVALAALLILPMSYIVTNVGSLVRLRLMALVPFWTLALAMGGVQQAGTRAGVQDRLKAPLAGPGR